MKLSAKDIIDSMRTELEDDAGAQGSYFSDDVLLQCVRRVHNKMVHLAVESAEDFFGRITDANVAAGQDIFPLFDDFLKLRLLEYRPGGTGEPRQIIEGRKVEGLFGFGTGLGGPSDKAYAIFGDDIQIDPKFDQAETAALRQYYIAEPPPPLLGTVAAASSTTITLNSRAPRQDDMLNGTQIEITEGTGAGQIRTISDYVGLTRVATISSAWSTVPDTTSKYATFTRVPSLFHDLLIVGGIQRAKQSRDENSAAYADEENDLFERYEEFCEQRSMAGRVELPFDAGDGLG
jgi:hypothetical protein